VFAELHQAGLSFKLPGMGADSDMEELRVRIRAALAADSSKSQKELAKSLGISPAQVTSLLKPGGRRLQASEVPIVEHYLGLRLFQREERPPLLGAYQVPAGAEIAARAAPVALPAPGPLTPEGTLVALDAVPEEIRPAMEKLLEKRAAEFWRLTATRIHDAGYIAGDYVVVDRGEPPRSGDVVLAEVRHSAGRWIPIFRVFAPPLLKTAHAVDRTPNLQVSNPRIAVIGPVVASFRTREPR
jgi:SOS-response transcriptional repressor LexA